MAWFKPDSIINSQQTFTRSYKIHISESPYMEIQEVSVGHKSICEQDSGEQGAAGVQAPASDLGVNVFV